jgi:hypothetical protein
MEDCNTNHDGDHRMAVTNLFKRWFAHEVIQILFEIFIILHHSNCLYFSFTLVFLQVNNDNEKLGDLINTFWSEFEEFQSKSGPYLEREYIFRNHSDLIDSRVYIWHKKETLRYTPRFLGDLHVGCVQRF